MRYTLMRHVYALMVSLALPLLLLRLLWRSRREPVLRQHWGHRLGFLPKQPPGTLWFHAVSVGEWLSLHQVIACVLADPSTHLLITVTTAAALEQASQHTSPRLQVAFLPLDRPQAWRRAWQRVHPSVFVMVESEIWPNLLHHAQQQGTPVSLINACLSPRSLARYLRFKRHLTPLWACLTWVAAQDHRQAHAWASIGIPRERISMLGHLKHDLKSPDPEQTAAWNAWFQGRRVWLVASTHEGEEALMLQVFKRLKGVCPDVLLVMAPRHAVRFEAVAASLVAAGVLVVRRSQKTPLTEGTDVVLLDTLGELRGLFGAAQVACVAGSWVPIGGHNPLEAIIAGVPVCMGPHTESCQTTVDSLLAMKALAQPEDAEALFQVLASWLQHPETIRPHVKQAQTWLLAQQGASQRVAEHLLQLRLSQSGAQP